MKTRIEELEKLILDTRLKIILEHGQHIVTILLNQLTLYVIELHECKKMIK